MKRLNLLTLMIISFTAIISYSCTDSIQQINTENHAPLIYNGETWYNFDTLSKMISSDIQQIRKLRLIDFDSGFIRISLEENNNFETLIDLKWNDQQKDKFLAKIKGIEFYTIEVSLQATDITYIIMSHGSSTLIEFRFSYEENEWSIAEGKFRNISSLQEKHNVLISIYSPIISTLLDYIRNPDIAISSNEKMINSFY